MKVFAVLLFAMMSFNLYAFEVKPSLSGSWYNPAQDGHGFSVEVMDENTTVAYWYTYDHDEQPIFLVAVGQNIGSRVEAEVYYTDGLKFGEFDPNGKSTRVWGALTIDFHSCRNATVTYNSSMSHSGEIFGSGSLPLQKLISIADNKCTENKLGGNYVLAGSTKSGLALLGAAVVFENGTTMYAGKSSDGEAAVGLGVITEGSNSFEFTGQEYGINSDYYYEFDAEGEYYTPGLFEFETNLGALIGVQTRSEFMTTVPVSTMAKSWRLTDYFGVYRGDLRLHSNGAVEGKVMDGCDVSGEWFMPNPELNQTWMNLELNNCSISGTSYAAAIYSEKDNNLTIMGVTAFGGYVLDGK